MKKWFEKGGRQVVGILVYPLILPLGYPAENQAAWQSVCQ